jgi:hypothetical protein
MGLENVSFSVAGYGRWHTPAELEGFVEEIKEPEGFWFVELDGKVVSSEQIDDHDCVAKEFRFPSFLSAAAFADGMKSTMSFKIDTVHHCDQARFLIQALNSRRSHD